MTAYDKTGIALGRLLDRSNPFRTLVPLKVSLFAGLIAALFLEFSTELDVNWKHGIHVKIGGADAVVAVSACALALLLVLVDLIAGYRWVKLQERIWDVILDPDTPARLRSELFKQINKRR